MYSVNVMFKISVLNEFLCVCVLLQVMDLSARQLLMDKFVIIFKFWIKKIAQNILTYFIQISFCTGGHTTFPFYGKFLAN